MSAVPTLAREEWPTHPRYPSQTLLLESHESFLRVQNRLEQMAKDDASGPRAELLFRRWMYAMASHEHYEESKLYRYLSRRWDVSMDHLTAGHEALAERKGAVFDAFATGSKAEIVTALEAFGDTLRRHLDLEERTVIPLLLELEPDEFFDYYRFPIETLLEQLEPEQLGGANR